MSTARSNAGEAGKHRTLNVAGAIVAVFLIYGSLAAQTSATPAVADFGDEFVGLTSDPVASPAVSNFGAIAAADLNADGRLDMAFASGPGRTSTIGIMLGDGQGRFSLTAQEYTAGPYPAGTTIADITGDGIADIVVPNTEANFLTFLIGNTDGTFYEASDLLVGQGPRVVIVEDFNRDGITDLATVNGVSNNLTVLLGGGMGSFAPAVAYVTGNGPRHGAAGDFNADGYPDIAVASGSSLAVLLNQGNGTFTAPIFYPEVGRAAFIAATDLNHDNRLDLITVNEIDNLMLVIFGNGDGSFQYPVAYTTDGSRPLFVKPVDFDGDTNIDVAVTYGGSNAFGFFRGSSNGVLERQPILPVPNYIESLGIGDFNEDGMPDVAVSDFVQAQLLVFPGKGVGGIGGYRSVTLSNQGNEPAVISSTEFTGTNPGDFSRRTPLIIDNRFSDCVVSRTLQPGESCRVLFAFAPNAAGPRSANFAITLDNGTTHVLELLGNGVPTDSAPPAIQCGDADSLWHGTDVAIACVASDSGSGLANAADAAFSLTTAVATGTETSNASTNSRQVCDVAGNCATAGPIVGNMVDKKSPAISITAPANAAYLLNQAAAASYSCSDGGSGVFSCTGPVASGANFDTASVGSKTFMVNARDKVSNSSSASTNYSVVYSSAGLCRGETGHQIMQPINADGSSIFKKNSTVPAKFRVCDANGYSVSTAGVVSSFSLVQIISGTYTDNVNEQVDSTTPDSAFRWDSGAQQWIFNISTKSLSTNKTYVYRITLNDGSTISFQFGLK